MPKFTTDNQPTNRKTRGKSKKTLLLEKYGEVFETSNNLGINPLQLLTVITTKLLSKNNNTIGELELLRKIANDVLHVQHLTTLKAVTTHDVTFEADVSDIISNETFILGTEELLQKFRVNDSTKIGDNEDE